MSTQEKPAAASAPGGSRQRSITFTVSPATVVSSIIVLCSGMVAVFCLGIFLGRGNNIETRLPELERILPESVPTTPPLVIDAESSAAANQAQAGGQETQADTDDQSASHNQVMTQADLGYRDHLKTPARPQSAAQNRSTPAQPPKPADSSGQKKKTDDKPAAGRQPSAKSAPQAPASKPRPAPPAAPAAGKDTQTYNYVYQAAAYKDQASCDRFTATLKNAGFKARTEKTVSDSGTAWYRVMIDFRGRPDDTDALRAKLKNHGVPRVILKAKVPTTR